MPDPRATVLVVDDTQTKRYILSSWLRRAGHQVVEASGGEEALTRVAELRPDLVVLDVRLPDIDGFEVCERIKADPGTSSTPVIQISGKAVTPADRTEGLERGADAYLSEPVEPQEFTATVEATLRYYRARQRAELMAARLARLAEISLKINEAETFDHLLHVAVVGAAGLLERHTEVLALPPDGRLRSYGAHPGRTAIAKMTVPDSLNRFRKLDATDQAGITTITLDPADWPAATGADPTVAGWGILCRTKQGRPPVYLGVRTQAPLDSDEVNLLRQLGQALALAVDALRVFTEEHTIALTLQRSLLPRRLPEVPGLSFAVRYQPAADNVEIGGDFYEVLPLGDRLLVAIGDVAGHSLYAATVMAELRHALRASIIGSADLARTLTLLNKVLLRYHPGMTATVCLLVIDPATGEVELANAGHIPPLLVNGETEYHRFGNLLLGVADEEYRVDRIHLAPGGSIVLFTDGLVEDPATPLDENLEVVRKLSESIDDDLDGFCDRLARRFGPRTDDVALVALRRPQR
ncbi:fused response regulator/phosphatase [Spongiactinospora sp. TRM90649]|uniref:fused response regulator/phosphatase n=1 Tax=Spongiactinospora sp. TRM90649 TaxID=3031114 RepID=UPI0023F8E7F2|nr:fused response regulator/phosphatase [Spongiactinospora sp. TRM90649]MDF5755766.1 fused response regulator/phosphatase [Spongiactinospora sp. TRM90649]